MKPKNGEQVYKLIHSQEMVQYMWKYSVHRQSTQIPLAIAFDEELDFKLLARAVNIEIERNDCMRLRIFRDGMKVRQYFLNEYKLEKAMNEFDNIIELMNKKRLERKYKDKNGDKAGRGFVSDIVYEVLEIVEE